jgi:hypothetical protein
MNECAALVAVKARNVNAHLLAVVRRDAGTLTFGTAAELALQARCASSAPRNVARQSRSSA